MVLSFQILRLTFLQKSQGIESNVFIFGFFELSIEIFERNLVKNINVLLPILARVQIMLNPFNTLSSLG